MESRLVASLRQRDPEGLREAYRLYSRPVFGYLSKFLADRASAEDVQQQVFMEAWEKADRFDPGRGSFLTWLMTIARSRAIDHVRKRVPEPHDPEGTARLIDSRPSENDDFAEVVETWQFSQIIGRLPAEEADLLRYRFQGQLSQSEIAKETGIPLGTVKSRMVSGLERLRQMMEVEA
ncbi:MAG: sigma-70 family RNA polymerase sigma factor [Actinomycetota bacterium]|nr:sigma-70 family RNA polymerase sigma factor [Actinomycetota bacterium]